MLGVAGEHPATLKPPFSDVLHCEGVYAPAADIPANAHRPKLALDIANVEDVPVATRGESSLLPLRLLGKQVEDMGQGGFSIVVELPQNVSVVRGFAELVAIEGRFRSGFFDLSAEPVLEVAPDPVDADLTDLEVVPGHELLHGGDGDGSEEGEDGLEDGEDLLHKNSF